VTRDFEKTFERLFTINQVKQIHVSTTRGNLRIEKEKKKCKCEGKCHASKIENDV